jgi:hypothetical protein
MQVRQVCRFWADPADPLQGLFHMYVRRMRCVAQRVEDPCPHALKLREAFLRHVRDVIAVGEIPEAKAERMRPTVSLIDRDNVDHPTRPFNAQRLARRRKTALLQNWRIRRTFRCAKALAEALIQLLARLLVHVDGYTRLNAKGDRSQIIQAVSLVGVIVGHQDSVQFADGCRQ